jgi:hypothetical protein
VCLGLPKPHKTQKNRPFECLGLSVTRVREEPKTISNNEIKHKNTFGMFKSTKENQNFGKLSQKRYDGLR